MTNPLFDAFLKYPAQSPRYTSYPTAPHFKPVSSEQYACALQSIPAGEAISLYIHIPYCKKLCWFCGCNTKIIRQYEPIRKYLTLLAKEMGILTAIMDKRKLRVSHIHFGGGSPTLLESADFLNLMAELHTHFVINEDAEIAIEIDPRTANEAKIAAYAKCGINRVSIGVQDFNEDIQVAVNRFQPLRLVYDTVALCRDYGINTINFDLIYGLPGQTPEHIRRTIEHTVLLSPGRIALFGYAHVPWKKKNMNLVDEQTLPSEKERLELYDVAALLLREKGYIAIGIDHFVKNSDAMFTAWKSHALRRNFQGYTSDKSNNIIGIGVSAISALSSGYFQNSASVEDYAHAVNNGTPATARGHIFSPEDKVRRDIIEEIMCYMQLDLRQLQLLPDWQEIDVKLVRLACDELVYIQNRMLFINKKIPQSARIACSLFDRYFDSMASLHGKVT